MLISALTLAAASCQCKIKKKSIKFWTYLWSAGKICSLRAPGIL